MFNVDYVLVMFCVECVNGFKKNSVVRLWIFLHIESFEVVFDFGPCCEIPGKIKRSS